MKGKALTTLAAVLIILAIAITVVFYDDLIYFINGSMDRKICNPDYSKNKVAVIITKDGIYDNEEINLQVSKYFDSVKKDLNIDNAGLKKFSGKTISELDQFVDGIYLNNNVVYVILLGDDMPTVISETKRVVSYNNETGGAVYNITDSMGRDELVEAPPGSYREGTYYGPAGQIYQKLECVGRDCDYDACSDLAISSILPPLHYLDDEKVAFVLNILKTYTGYHNNFKSLSAGYQRSLLHIRDFSNTNPLKAMGYDMPKIVVLNNESERVWEEAEKKHIVLSYDVHGQTGIVGIGLSNETIESIGKKYPLETELNIGKKYPDQQDLLLLLQSEKMYTTLDEWLNFSKEYGVPSLFVDAFACQFIELEDSSLNHCCWPQVYMESGVWAYYTFGGNEGRYGEIELMQRGFSRETTIGLAIRKFVISQEFIFGDILAHMK